MIRMILRIIKIAWGGRDRNQLPHL